MRDWFIDDVYDGQDTGIESIVKFPGFLSKETQRIFTQENASFKENHEKLRMVRPTETSGFETGTSRLLLLKEEAFGHGGSNNYQRQGTVIHCNVSFGPLYRSILIYFVNTRVLYKHVMVRFIIHEIKGNREYVLKIYLLY